MRGFLLCLSVVVFLLAFGRGVAQAQDLNTQLADQQVAAADAAADSEAASGQINEAKDELAPIEQQADIAADKATAATGEVKDIRSNLVGDRHAADQRIEQISERNATAKQTHGNDVNSGYGIGVAALLLALFPVGWGRFRRMRPVLAVADQPLPRTLAVAAAGIFVSLVVGGGIASGSGAARLFGLGIAIAGSGVAVTLVLARHSLKVERREEQCLLSAEPFPRKAMLVVAAALGLVGVIGFGSSVTSSDPALAKVPAAVSARADLSPDQSDAVAKAEAHARPLVVKSREARAREGRAQAKLAQAQGRLDAAKRRAKRANQLVTNLTARIQRQDKLAALAAQRAAEKAARQQQRQAQAALKAQTQPASSGGGGCDSNYSGCLDPNSPDYDCEGGSGDGPDYTGPVEVVGIDEFDLDADGDGSACDT